MLKNRYVIRTLPEMRETIANILSSITEGRSVDEASLFNIRLVLNELIVNAFIHGNADAQDAPVTVLVDPDETEPALTIEVEDGGVGFSAAPPAEQAGGSIREHGRGLVLVKALTREMVFNERGNRVSVRMNL
jgi:serine/threonine-protein kinase RsbW